LPGRINPDRSRIDAGVEWTIGLTTIKGVPMIWLLLVLLVAFATMQTIVIERLYREKRRADKAFDEFSEQFDALASVVDRQILTQEQIEDQTKPVAAAIRETSTILTESTEALLGSIREAKTERRKLEALIAATASADMSRTSEKHVPSSETGEANSEEIGNNKRMPNPLPWPDAEKDVTSIAGKPRRVRPEVVITEQSAPAAPVAKKATG
jgi:Na+-transporting methylmalonyl-CoA/oxaloacetate decarboxylase gamma subunit